MSFAPQKLKTHAKPSANKSDSSILKDSIGGKLSIIRNSLKHTSEDMEKLQILSEFLSKESEILDLESQLASEISKLKDLESKILAQNSEFQHLLHFTENPELSEVFPGEFFDKSLENREAEIQRYKIECKEEIIKVLKLGLKELFEMKNEFNSELNEIRTEIAEVSPMIINLTLEQELDILEDGGGEWLKNKIERIIECIYTEFVSDIEKKFEEYKELFFDQVTSLRNSLAEIKDEGSLNCVRIIQHVNTEKPEI